MEFESQKIEQESLAESSKNYRKERLEQVRSIAGILVSSFVLAFLMLTFVFRTYNVHGSSMRPTLTNGDRVVVNKFTKTKAGDDYIPARGQIVVFDSALEGKSLIKRVIALPGEKISMTNGRFKVVNDKYPNGFDPDASYEDTLPKNDTTTFEEKTIPGGHIFVSGDNRSPSQSLDSRNALGFVPIEELIGNASLRYYPLDSAGKLK
jgi:signal peptidase I